MSAPKAIDWNAIEAEFVATDTPVLQIAAKYGVSEGAIRAKAKKHGWVRSSLPLKRALVEQRISGITNGFANHEVRKALESEADEAASDMRMGLGVARSILERLFVLVDETEEPKDLKIIAESNKIAVETIRRIRGLDDTSQATDTGRVTIYVPDNGR